MDGTSSARLRHFIGAEKLICKDHPPIALLCYCEECKKFICSKCIKIEPEEHIEKFQSNLPVLITEKIQQYILNKESQKAQLEVFSKRNQLFKTLIQQLQNVLDSDIRDSTTNALEELKQNKILEKINQSFTINSEQFHEISPLLTGSTESTRNKEEIEKQREINAKVQWLIEELSKIEHSAPKVDKSRIEEPIGLMNSSFSRIAAENISTQATSSNKPDPTPLGSDKVPEKLVLEEQKKAQDRKMDIETNIKNINQPTPTRIENNVQATENQPLSGRNQIPANIGTSSIKLVSTIGEKLVSKQTKSEKERFGSPQSVSTVDTANIKLPTSKKTKTDKIPVEKEITNHSATAKASSSKETPIKASEPKLPQSADRSGVAESRKPQRWETSLIDLIQKSSSKDPTGNLIPAPKFPSDQNTAIKSVNDKMSIEKPLAQKETKTKSTKVKPSLPIESLGKLPGITPISNQVQENITPSKTIKEKIKTVREKTIPAAYTHTNINETLLHYFPKLFSKKNSGKIVMKFEKISKFMLSPDDFRGERPLPSGFDEFMGNMRKQYEEIKELKKSIKENYYKRLIEEAQGIAVTEITAKASKEITDILKLLCAILQETSLKPIVDRILSIFPAFRKDITIQSFLWIRTVLRNFEKNITELQKTRGGRAQQNGAQKPGLGSMQKELFTFIKRLTKLAKKSELQTSSWTIAVGLSVVYNLSGEKLWKCLHKIGLSLATNNFVEKNCPLLYLAQEKKLFNCISRKLLQVIQCKSQPGQVVHKPGIDMLYFLRKKQQFLKPVLRTHIPKPIKKVWKDYIDFTKKLVHVKLCGNSEKEKTEFSKLEEERKNFPLKIPKIQESQVTREKMNTLIEYVQGFDGIKRNNWSVLCKSVGVINRLSSELKHELPKDFRQKIRLIPKIWRTVNAPLNGKTKYQSLLDLESQIKELVKIDPSFLDYSKFLLQRVWISKVRLIKFSTEDKLVLDPLLTIDELRNLEKQGSMYKNAGKSEKDRKDLAAKNAFISSLLARMGEKIQEINRIKTPEEWMNFQNGYMNTISYVEYLEKRKWELMKEYPVDEFRFSSSQMRPKREYVSNEEKEQGFDDYIPEVEYQEEIIDGNIYITID